MMKRIISIFGVLSAVFFSAQTSLTNTENYIYSKECLNDDCTKASEKVQYYDSFGRPYQSISIKASPSGKDMVQHIPYDRFGRSVDSWYPVPMNTLGGAIQDSSSVKGNALTVYGDTRPFSHTTLEKSPLSRPLSQIPPGQEWQTHLVTMGYSTNTGSEVKKYIVSTTWGEGRTESVLSLLGNYPANTLVKNTVTDENGKVSVEYKNKQGQLILVKKAAGTTDVTDTYYVYNEYNQLVYVLPPLAANASITPEILEKLCYQYRYDKMKRLVEKKIPGKGWEYMVYDKADRLILFRDTNLKNKGKWLITKYDPFGRIAYTGLISGEERAVMQDQILNSVVSETRNEEGFIRNGMSIFYSNLFFNDIGTVLGVNYYDTYPSYSFNPPVPATVFGSQILTDNMTADMNTKGLPVLSLVKNIENDNWTKNYVWYDTKRRAVGAYSINHLGGYTKTESDIDFSGLVNQTKVYHKRLSTDTEKLIIQNYQYDAQGRLLVQKHKVDSNPEEILTQNEYNQLSQIVKKKVGGNNIAQPLQTIDYAYNIRGWMTGINQESLKINGMAGRLFAYDIRYQNPTDAVVSPKQYNGNISEISWKIASNGVLKRYVYNYDGLNRLTEGIFSNPDFTTPLNHFNDELASYDLNGNIVKLKRNAKSLVSTTEEVIDDLLYEYDGNRLQRVNDQSGNPTGYEGGINMKGNRISYDENGNMTDMLDKQINEIGYNYLNLPNALRIENTKKKMVYVYRADGVKLKKTFNFTKEDGGVFTTVTDYLDGFQYLTTAGSKPNELDPIKYAYEQEAFLEESSTEHPAPELQFVPTAEGFYDFTKNEYIYQYKDHLGNVRVSYRKNAEGSAEITDQNDYYPFGMNILREEKAVFGTASLYNYKYNGKELQETGMYDYGARMYMPDIARWGVIDPLAENSRRWSPYAYAYNSPMMFIDPDGRQNVSALRWNFDSNTTILGSSWFADSYNFGRLGGSEKFFWQDAAGGGSPGLFLESDMYKSALNYLAYEPDFAQFDFGKFGLDEDGGGKKKKGKAQKDASGDKINWFNPSDGGLYIVAENNHDIRNNTVRIFAHGNSNGVLGPDGKMVYFPEKFDEILIDRSPSWKTFRENGNNGKMILDLKACNTGSVEYSFAHKLSMDPRFKGVVIIAPADYFIADPDGKSAHVGGPGNYNIFLNGKLIRGKYNTKN